MNPEERDIYVSVANRDTCVCCQSPPSDKGHGRAVLYTAVCTPGAALEVVQNFFGVKFSNDLSNANSFVCVNCRRRIERYNTLVKNAEEIKKSLLSKCQTFAVHVYLNRKRKVDDGPAPIAAKPGTQATSKQIHGTRAKVAMNVTGNTSVNKLHVSQYKNIAPSQNILVNTPTGQNILVNTPTSQNILVNTPTSQNILVNTPSTQNILVNAPTNQNILVNTPTFIVSNPGSNILKLFTLKADGKNENCNTQPIAQSSLINKNTQVQPSLNINSNTSTASIKVPSRATIKSVQYYTKSLAKKLHEKIVLPLVAGSVIKAVKNIAEEFPDEFRKAVCLQLSKECKGFHNLDSASTLRNSNVEDILKFKLDDIASCIDSISPLLWACLRTAAINKKSECNVAGVVNAASVLLRSRNTSLNIVAVGNAIAMHRFRVSKQGFMFLEKIGLCCSYKCLRERLGEADKLSAQDKVVWIWNNEIGLENDEIELGEDELTEPTATSGQEELEVAVESCVVDTTCE